MVLIWYVMTDYTTQISFLKAVHNTPTHYSHSYGTSTTTKQQELMPVFVLFSKRTFFLSKRDCLQISGWRISVFVEYEHLQKYK